MIKQPHLYVLGVSISTADSKIFSNIINASIVPFKNARPASFKRTQLKRKGHIISILLAVFLDYHLKKSKMIRMMILSIISSFEMKLALSVKII